MRKFLALLMLLMIANLAFGHEGHHSEIVELNSPQTQWFSTTPSFFIKWLGSLHPVFLHFPIALIIMTVLAEVLFAWYGQIMFAHAARFMLIAAAVTSVPTVLFGLALGAYAEYGGVLESFFWWHRFLGIFTALMVILTASLKECAWLNQKLYYSSLAILFILVNATSFLGGALTFGISPWAIFP